jgi:hydroxymethylglutaryl-CoA lyase
VVIRDVTLRDGLQNQAVVLPTERKAALYDALAGAGVEAFQVTSFVSPKRIPQLADAEELWSTLGGRPGVRDALIANLRGYERAVQVGVDRVELVLALSETYHRKNSGRSREATLHDFEPLIGRAARDGVHVGIGLANVWHCTYEGFLAPEVALDWGERFYALGVRDIGLADTTGAARTEDVRALVERARRAWPDAFLRVHLHDAGRGVANAAAALEAGADALDATLGGVGGSPFAGEVGGNLDLLAVASWASGNLDGEALKRAWDELRSWLEAPSS